MTIKLMREQVAAYAEALKAALDIEDGKEKAAAWGAACTNFIEYLHSVDPHRYPREESGKVTYEEIMPLLEDDVDEEAADIIWQYLHDDKAPKPVEPLPKAVRVPLESIPKAKAVIAVPRHGRMISVGNVGVIGAAGGVGKSFATAGMAMRRCGALQQWGNMPGLELFKFPNAVSSEQEDEHGRIVKSEPNPRTLIVFGEDDIATYRDRIEELAWHEQIIKWQNIEVPYGNIVGFSNNPDIVETDTLQRDPLLMSRKPLPTDISGMHAVVDEALKVMHENTWLLGGVGGIFGTDQQRYAEMPKKMRGFDALDAAMDEIRPGLVIIDPLSAFFQADLNAMAGARAFMDLLTGMAVKYECGILMIAHSTKAARDGSEPAGLISGSAAWFDAARGTIGIVPATEDFIKEYDAPEHGRVLVPGKANRGSTDWRGWMKWVRVPYWHGYPIEGSIQVGMARTLEANSSQRQFSMLAKEGENRRQDNEDDWRNRH